MARINSTSSATRRGAMMSMSVSPPSQSLALLLMKTVTLFVARALGLALDINVMLQWVYWGDKVDFANEQTRDMCKKLLGEDVEPEGVLKYLQQQAKELETWRDRLGMLKH
jgi:hypothetical protein